MNLYKFSDYRQFIREMIQSRPARGRGELMKMAVHIGIHTTTLSQVIASTRQFTPEQAAAVCAYFGLDDLETRYFLLLVQLDRAGTKELKHILEKQLDEIRKGSTELANLLPHEKTLTPEENAAFYSQWFYSAIRVLSSVDGFQTAEAIAERLHLPRKRVQEAIGFLVKSKLCVQEGGRLSPGPQYTHIEAGSPLASRHHGNWRQKAIERHARMGSEELAYTSPMSVSAKDAAEIRELAIEFVKRVNEIRSSSSPERALFLNLDWLSLD